MEEILFYQDMHRLYDQILASSNRVGHDALSQDIIVYETRTLTRFGRAIRAVVGRINFLVGMPYFSIQYEGDARWTLMGIHSRDWIEIWLVNARCFKITRLLCDTHSMPCGFRRNGTDMESDVSNALRMVLGKPTRRTEAPHSPHPPQHCLPCPDPPRNPSPNPSAE